MYGGQSSYKVATFFSKLIQKCVIDLQPYLYSYTTRHISLNQVRLNEVLHPLHSFLISAILLQKVDLLFDQIHMESIHPLYCGLDPSEMSIDSSVMVLVMFQLHSFG